MSQQTDKETIWDQIAEAWSEMELSVKLCFLWLGLVAIALIVIGIIFPVAGWIILGIVALFVTIGVIGHLMDY